MSTKKTNRIFCAGFLLMLFFLIWYLINTAFGFNLDIKITQTIFNCGHSDWLMYFFIFVTNYTLGEITGVALMLIFGAFKKDKYFLVISIISILIILGLDSVLKNLFERVRPYLSIPDIHNISDYRLNDFSFPSGHTVFAFFIAYIMVGRFNITGVKKYAIYLLAILVGFSRIYLGVHFFGDVLAGAVLGTMFGIMAMCVLDRHPRAR